MAGSNLHSLRDADSFFGEMMNHLVADIIVLAKNTVGICFKKLFYRLCHLDLICKICIYDTVIELYAGIFKAVLIPGKASDIDRLVHSATKICHLFHAL